MQSNNNTFITNKPAESYVKKGMVAKISNINIIEMSIYLAVRHSVATNWLNNKDVLLYPSNEINNDIEFQKDCLIFALFDNTNNVSCKIGINHWIPFTESEVNSKEKFESNFMSNFINEIIKSDEAKAVFDAGKELWKYYHSQKDINVNASFYDIREYFQGRNDKGRMNSRSTDEKYTELIGNLRVKLNIVADKIKPKIYEYGFLKE